MGGVHGLQSPEVAAGHEVRNYHVSQYPTFLVWYRVWRSVVIKGAPLLILPILLRTLLQQPLQSQQRRRLQEQLLLLLLLLPLPLKFVLGAGGGGGGGGGGGSGRGGGRVGELGGFGVA